MQKCPVCEHSQDFGFECEACGSALDPLGVLPAPPAPAVKLDGLELHQFETAEGTTDLAVGLERHAYVVDGAVTASATPVEDLERTEFAAQQVAVEALAIDADRAEPSRSFAVAPTRFPCRYCRHVQASGAVCEKCGSFLPRVAQAQLKPTAELRCTACGALTQAAARCPACGHPQPDT
jgi:lipopolysaccharide biosynthesis regulator YciM